MAINLDNEAGYERGGSPLDKESNASLLGILGAGEKEASLLRDVTGQRLNNWEVGRLRTLFNVLPEDLEKKIVADARMTGNRTDAQPAAPAPADARQKPDLAEVRDLRQLSAPQRAELERSINAQLPPGSPMVTIQALIDNPKETMEGYRQALPSEEQAAFDRRMAELQEQAQIDKALAEAGQDIANGQRPSHETLAFLGAAIGPEAGRVHEYLRQQGKDSAIAGENDDEKNEKKDRDFYRQQFLIETINQIQNINRQLIDLYRERDQLVIDIDKLKEEITDLKVQKAAVDERVDQLEQKEAQQTADLEITQDKLEEAKQNLEESTAYFDQVNADRTEQVQQMQQDGLKDDQGQLITVEADARSEITGEVTYRIVTEDNPEGVDINTLPADQQAAIIEKIKANPEAVVDHAEWEEATQTTTGQNDFLQSQREKVATLEKEVGRIGKDLETTQEQLEIERAEQTRLGETLQAKENELKVKEERLQDVLEKAEELEAEKARLSENLTDEQKTAMETEFRSGLSPEDQKLYDEYLADKTAMQELQQQKVEQDATVTGLETSVAELQTQYEQAQQEYELALNDLESSEKQTVLAHDAHKDEQRAFLGNDENGNQHTFTVTPEGKIEYWADSAEGDPQKVTDPSLIAALDQKMSTAEGQALYQENRQLMADYTSDAHAADTKRREAEQLGQKVEAATMGLKPGEPSAPEQREAIEASIKDDLSRGARVDLDKFADPETRAIAEQILEEQKFTQTSAPPPWYQPSATPAYGTSAASQYNTADDWPPATKSLSTAFYGAAKPDQPQPAPAPEPPVVQMAYKPASPASPSVG